VRGGSRAESGAAWRFREPPARRRPKRGGAVEFGVSDGMFLTEHIYLLKRGEVGA
jgi:hypothetical protein